MKIRSSLLAALCCCSIVLAGACAPTETDTEPAPETDGEETAAEGSAPDDAGPVTLEGDFSTPESVLHDAERDVYLVSNIGGSPLEADGNGTISRIDAESHEIEARWIDGAADGVTLNAPKGMAIVGDTLWVSDITVVRRFDRTTGEPTGEVAIEGATFLNDLAAGSDGSVYVSDSGLTAGEDGFVPSGTAAVHRIDSDGNVESLIAGEELMGPNGLLATSDGLWVVSFGGNELYRVEEGAKAAAVQLPAGSLDGIVQLEDGDLLISSWESSAIYRGPATGPFEIAVPDVAAPADIGLDAGRGLVLIPLFQDDRVLLQPLE